MIVPERPANAIAVHPYRDTVPETLVPDWLLLRRFVDARLRRGTQIWDTEWGYSSFGSFPMAVYGDGHSYAARRRQAVLATRCFLAVLALGSPVAVWYDLQDDGSQPTDEESNFGLIDQQGNDKMAIRAIRVLTGAASRHTLLGMLADVPAGVHALQLEGDSEVTVILWCDESNGSSQVRFSASDLMYAAGLFGQEVPISVSADKTATVMVTEAGGPIYLHLHPSPTRLVSAVSR